MTILLSHTRVRTAHLAHTLKRAVAVSFAEMPVVHIVLVKVKQAVLSNGFDELKQMCETLKDLPITKSKATEVKWGPPAYPGRNEGYNWGESRKRPSCMHAAVQLRKIMVDMRIRAIDTSVRLLILAASIDWCLTARFLLAVNRIRRCTAGTTGLYSVFASREDYEAYRDDEEHRK